MTAQPDPQPTVAVPTTGSTAYEPPATVRTGASSGSDVGTERTLGQLVSDASRDLSAIMRSEVALAKAEVKAEATTAVMGGAMFAVAGVVAFLAVILLLFAAVYGLVEAGLDRWLSFLIIAVVLLIIGGILALIGKSRLSKLSKPERTMRTTKETVETLKSAKPHSA